MSLDKKLDFWIKNNYNVLFKGKHGVGKTTSVLEAFNKSGLKWMYFSASTMDPFCDFVGIPKEVKDENGNSYLDLIRPRQFQNDEVEALFFDEFNRAPKKVRNAVMELIQFKSINGKKFNKLRVVWAAINPDDEKDLKYDVEELDPAQIDRFHVMVDVPYIPNSLYFKNKYGEEIAFAAVNWWNELPKEAQTSVSPRRLDYAIDMYKNGGDIRDVLPRNVEINKLLLELKNGPITKQLKHFFVEKNVEGARAFLNVENNYNACIDMITKDYNYTKFFAPFLSDEKLISLAAKHESIISYLCENYAEHEELIKNVVKANSNKNIVRRLKDTIDKHASVTNILKSGDNNKISKYYNDCDPIDFYNHLKICKQTTSTTQQRSRNYHIIKESIPEKILGKDINTTFKILMDIVRRSNENTINQCYTDLIPMINHVIIKSIELKHDVFISSRDLYLLKKYNNFIYCEKVEKIDKENLRESLNKSFDPLFGDDFLDKYKSGLYF